MPQPKPILELTKSPAKILLYGKPGNGKTALACSYGEGAEVLDIGRGLQSALTFKDAFYEDRRKCVVSECYDDRPDIANAWTKLKARVFEIGNECASKKYPYKCVIVDELTAIGLNCLRYILMNGGRLYGLNVVPTVKNGITQPEWGLAMQEVLNMMIVLRSLPVHVIMIAHDNSEDAVVRPEKTINVIGKKLTPQIPGYFDEVLYLNIDPQSKQRVLQTQPTYDTVARTRGQLPDKYPVAKGMRQLMIDAGYSPDLT
jgi:hypothetical protein